MTSSIWILILLLGCTAAPPQKEIHEPCHLEYLESVHSLRKDSQLFSIDEGSYVYEYSPDHAWKVRQNGYSEPIYMINTKSPDEVLVIPSMDDINGDTFSWGNWSTDSQSFYVYNNTFAPPGCPSGTDLVVYSLDMETGKFILSGNTSGWNTEYKCISANWSPDGSKIVGTFDDYSITMIDRHVRVLKKITPKLNSKQIVYAAWWDKSGIYMTVGDKSFPRFFKVIHVDENLEGPQQITPLKATYFSFIGSSRNAKEAFILQWPEVLDLAADDNSPFSILHVKLDNAEIINSISVPITQDSLQFSSISPDSNYIELVFYRQTYLLNVKRMEIVLCENISRVGEWDEASQGFQFTRVAEDRLLFGVLKTY